MSEYQIYTLSNGIKVAYRQVTSTKIVHCGIMFDIGSRDESSNQAGLAHFWEHMAFKGTEKRNSYHIINSLESVGGELNAFTTKEKICFYASVLDDYFDKAINLITDIAFNSTFPKKQLEIERGVILEEMAMYLDSPEDAIQDEFDELVFKDHPLGVNILGTKERVKSFTQQDFKDFIDTNLDTDRVVLSVVGNISPSKIIRVAQKYLDDILPKKSLRTRTSPTNYKQQVIRKKMNNHQSHMVMGRPAFALADPDRLPFFALVNLLGGPGMNSRFNLSLREKHGLVYHIEAGLSTFTDTGLFSIFFGTDPQNLEKATRLVYKEMKNLRTKQLGKVQLKTVKDQLKGQLAMAEESKQGFMLVMARSILDLGRVEPLDEIFDKIELVTASKMMELAEEMFDENKLSTLVYQ